MRRYWSICSLALMTAVAMADTPPESAAQPVGPPRVEPQVVLSEEAASELYGVDFAGQLRALNLQGHITPAAVIDGLKEGLAGNKTTDNDSIQRSQAFLRSWKHSDTDPAADPGTVPSVEEASVIYGINFGENLRRSGIQEKVSVAAIERGFDAGLAGTRKLSPGDQQQLRSYLIASVAAIAKQNLSAAGLFLEKNRHQKGVKTLASGLQYKILTPGDRKASSPGTSDEVLVEYRGTLLDGTPFDDSFQRGRPLKIRVDAAIKGWQEALTQMKPGAKWQLFVPPDLAYGMTPRRGIPAGSLLIFDMVLLDGTPTVGATETVPGAAAGDRRT